jgi:hypothetical protein
VGAASHRQNGAVWRLVTRSLPAPHLRRLDKLIADAAGSETSTTHVLAEARSSRSLRFFGVIRLCFIVVSST